MTNGRRLLAATTIAASAALAVPRLYAAQAGQQPSQPGQESTSPSQSAMPSAVEARQMTLTGTVQDIDYNARTVTLKDQQGRTVTLEAGPEVARFNEVKKGDTVKADYLESVAVVVGRPGQVSSAEGSGTMLVRNKTALPSGQVVHTDVMTAEVLQIDPNKRTAVLRGPQGDTIQVDVAPDVQNLENVKPGDRVLIKVTRSLAMSVSRAK